jgi:hypothetical protein
MAVGGEPTGTAGDPTSADGAAGDHGGAQQLAEGVRDGRGITESDLVELGPLEEKDAGHRPG